ncbi:hypothetical protein CRUP_010777 [Coryphaenoides rupestris]|nr:hypothetical protein CRUP_010777 [Coryphaenoides rupestris]
MDAVPAASVKILLTLGLLLTLLLPSDDSKSIVKQCSSAAICIGAMASAAVDQNGNGNTVQCCNRSDFCNVSGAPGAVATQHTLLPALSLLLLLLVVQ